MRIRVFCLFLALQLVSLALWAALFSGPKSLPKVLPVFQVAHTAAPKTSSSIAFEARSYQNAHQYLRQLQERQIEAFLAQLPAQHVQTVTRLVLDYNQKAHRGLAGGGTLILRAVNMTLKERQAVLIHELAHNVDYGFLVSSSGVESGFYDGTLPIYEGDPSLEFYRLSWVLPGQKHASSRPSDFVSGYAATNVFEDFAESYAYYILHNKNFRSLALKNAVLRAKYDFLKTRVFGGKTFDTGFFTPSIFTRPWDITVLDYDAEELLKG